jgi:pyrroloquinoline quinone (PQQ) biosynthesis protein C
MRPAMLLLRTEQRIAMPALKERLLGLYDLLPFHHHPFWTAVKKQELSLEQVVLGEVQHWIRTRAGRPLRREALDAAQAISPEIFQLLLQTFLEECTHDSTGPSHLDLIERLVTEGGFVRDQLPRTAATPANAAAIALYRDIGRRGAGCHMLGAGAVEFFYCTLCPDIFAAYVDRYGMTPWQAETYKIHGPMDKEHAQRAFSVLDEAVALHGEEQIEAAVRDAFVATSLHYDGMLHAATGKLEYWNGQSR